MPNCTGNSDDPLPVHLQRSKLKAAPWVSQLSAASSGYPWYCTPSAEGASAAGQWLWIWSFCEGCCLKEFLEGSHAARARRKSDTTSTLLPKNPKTPSPQLRWQSMTSAAYKEVPPGRVSKFTSFSPYYNQLSLQVPGECPFLEREIALFL